MLAPSKRMIEVSFSNPSSFSLDTAALQAVVNRTLLTHDVVMAEVGVHIIDEAEMTRLNEQYKHHKGSTDVLTFVLHDPEQPTPKFVETDESRQQLGDVFLCYPVIARDAQAAGESTQQRLEFLLEHGCLHLLGEHHD